MSPTVNALLDMVTSHLMQRDADPVVYPTEAYLRKLNDIADEALRTYRDEQVSVIIVDGDSVQTDATLVDVPLVYRAHARAALSMRGSLWQQVRQAEPSFIVVRR